MGEHILVFCGRADRDSLALTAYARELARAPGWSVAVLSVCGTDAGRFAAAGAARVWQLAGGGQCQDDLALARALAALIRRHEPKVVLAGTTVRERAVMAAAAMELGAGLTADCTALSLAPDGTLLQRRPAKGRSVEAQIVTRSPVQMATVRTGTLPRWEAHACSPVPGEMVSLPIPARVRMLRTIEGAELSLLRNAEIVVSGGLGIGSADGFEQLRGLASALHGSVGASRGAVLAGYAPFACQIGLTGCCVRPRVYIAVGISGAIQHVVGMNEADCVVAVNSDPNAPIFQYADVGVVGDWREIIPALTKLI